MGSVMDTAIDFFVHRPIRFYPPTAAQLALAVASVALYRWVSMTKERYKYISPVHYVPILTLATLSVFEMVPEWVPMIYSNAFMFWDSVVITRQRLKGDPWPMTEWVFVAHHVGCIFLNLHPMIGHPKLYAKRATSRLLFIEASNPFLYRWEDSKRYTDFLMVYAVFFGIRGVYFAWYMWWATGVVGKIDVLITCLYLLGASQWVIWLLPNAPKLWNYEQEMAKEAKAAKAD
mmetsp:Transcript_15375/g.39638  ORF Transcript_15375/g.39638 Transcript_15375/m.39638 type:complete len:232 (+) Transcript_15375:78-773(+)